MGGFFFTLSTRFQRRPSERPPWRLSPQLLRLLVRSLGLLATDRLRLVRPGHGDAAAFRKCSQDATQDQGHQRGLAAGLASLGALGSARSFRPAFAGFVVVGCWKLTRRSGWRTRKIIGRGLCSGRCCFLRGGLLAGRRAQYSSSSSGVAFEGNRSDRLRKNSDFGLPDFFQVILEGHRAVELARSRGFDSMGCRRVPARRWSDRGHFPFRPAISSRAPGTYARNHHQRTLIDMPNLGRGVNRLRPVYPQSVPLSRIRLIGQDL